ncbi:hypothetical protein QTA57_15820 [Fontisubflavum oceani]|uniref:hypothetical protein n=1 Tax=Fontisubflavum oceani TaxID=2978973 RepID=UPI0025B3B4E2|nr:hypothetical protein [Fontisubflavum oceani]WJY21220.1 hypothetical protein QTA57_15820 [Fontisubflavum oceani]
MTFMKPLTLLLALSLPTLALADNPEPMPLSYAVFEAAIPHMDLAECPRDLAAEDRFCRVTVSHDEVHVFAFSYDGDSPFVGHATYPADGLEALLQ